MTIDVYGSLGAKPVLVTIESKIQFEYFSNLFDMFSLDIWILLEHWLRTPMGCSTSEPGPPLRGRLPSLALGGKVTLAPVTCTPHIAVSANLGLE